MSPFNFLSSHPLLALLGSVFLSKESEAKQKNKELKESHILLLRYYKMIDEWIGKFIPPKDYAGYREQVEYSAKLKKLFNSLTSSRMQIFNTWLNECKEEIEEIFNSSQLMRFVIPENIRENGKITDGKALDRTSISINKAFDFSPIHKKIEVYQEEGGILYAAPESKLWKQYSQYKSGILSNDFIISFLNDMNAAETYYGIYFDPMCFREEILRKTTNKDDYERKRFLNTIPGGETFLFLMVRPNDHLIHFLFYVYMWCKEEYKYIDISKPVPTFKEFCALFEMNVLENPIIAEGGLSGYGWK